MWDTEQTAMPRESARKMLQEMTGHERFSKNTEFILKLRKKISVHSLSKNPTRSFMLRGGFDLEGIKKIHLEYRYAIVQPFTDALCAAQFRSYQLEDKGLCPPGGKLVPRFLLNLNCLDEFGFTPTCNDLKYYTGNPKYAHYPLFEEVMKKIGVNPSEYNKFIPSPEAQKAKELLLSSFEKFEEIITLLAVGEIQVILFSNALKVNTIKKGVDVSQGYYQVHGTEALGEINAHDDDHEDDCWAILASAITEDDYKRIETLAMTYLDAWDNFWIKMKDKYATPVQG